MIYDKKIMDKFLDNDLKIHFSLIDKKYPGTSEKAKDDISRTVQYQMYCIRYHIIDCFRPAIDFIEKHIMERLAKWIK